MKLWPKLIIVAYLTFIGGMVFMVTQSFKQNTELEYDDYYQREVNYQDKIDAIQRVKKLKQKPEISISNDTIHLVIPAHLSGFEQGDWYFYHITKKEGDRHIDLKDPKAFIPLSELEKGKYRLEVDWKGGKERYFYKEELNIDL